MSKSQHNPRGASSVDAHVGLRVRQRRTLLGLSQTQLGEKLGVTFQQIQKNERGFNRLGASRLWELGRVLDVPISFFFDGLEVDSRPVPLREMSEASKPTDALNRRETLELVRAYYKIQDPAVRRRLCDLMRAIAGEKDEAVLDQAAD